MRQDLIDIDNNLSLIPLVTLEWLIDNADIIALFDIVCKDTPRSFTYNMFGSPHDAPLF